MTLPQAIRSGEVLYGNDFTPEQMREWFDREKTGYLELRRSAYAGAYGYWALNRMLGAPLRGRHYDTCLVLGCADGNDVLSLGLDIGRIIGIEPAEEWHVAELGGIPAEFQVPALDGTFDLPDASVDLCIALGVLHHIPNVEHLVAEVGRVLKPGGRVLLRDPITSMGDWTIPRRGLTRDERGIPPKLMRRFIANAGLKLDREQFLGSGLQQIAVKLGRWAPYNSRAITALDAAVCKLTKPLARYWRPRKIDKLGPSMAAWWARKA